MSSIGSENKEKTLKQKIGWQGERIATLFLRKRRFKILEKNYEGKNFEIDIIARKKDILYFFEVKTILVFSETPSFYEYILPNENINEKKIRKIERGVRAFLNENDLSWKKTKWQIGFIAVKIYSFKRKALVEKIERLASNY